MIKVALMLAITALLGMALIVIAFPAHAGSEYAAVQKLHWKRSFAPIPERLSVTDGDTLDYVTRPDRKERLVYRVYGIDTPEIHLTCSAVKGKLARDEMAKFLKTGRVLLRVAREKDKYGRDLATVSVGGKDAGQHLIDASLAKPYFGGTKEPWCS